MLFLIALQFLTIIPIKRGLNITDDSLAKSMMFFPIVGLLIGGIQVAVFWCIYKFVSPLVIALLLLFISIILTGAIHIDGFADMIDGFTGGNSKDEILQIMKDSRIGAIGAVGVVCLILAKFVFLKEIIESRQIVMITKALLVIPILSRWSMVISAGISKYAREFRQVGIGRLFTEGIRTKIVCLASIVPIIGTIISFKLCGFFLICITLFVAFVTSRLAIHKIGGVTGDILGAINEITEVILLLIMATVRFCS